jgi:hypothetical protein
MHHHNPVSAGSPSPVKGGPATWSLPCSRLCCLEEKGAHYPPTAQPVPGGTAGNGPPAAIRKDPLSDDRRNPTHRTGVPILSTLDVSGGSMLLQPRRCSERLV